MDESKAAVQGYPELLRQAARLVRIRQAPGDNELARWFDRARFSLSDMLRRRTPISLKAKNPHLFHAVKIAAAIVEANNAGA